MRRLWRINNYPLVRSSAVFLALQPLLLVWPTTPRFLEWELLVLGALLGYGTQATLSRERAEYLWQLPFTRREVARSLHFEALTVLGFVCLCAYLNAVCGFMRYYEGWTLWMTGSSGAPVWETHVERALWFNLLGVPLFSYWVSVTVLQRRRRQPKEMLERVGWLLLLGVLVMPLTLISMPGETNGVFSASWRSLPGVVCAIAACWLAARALARAGRLGIDAFPVESLAWES